jgi:hypothetical protein
MVTPALPQVTAEPSIDITFPADKDVLRKLQPTPVRASVQNPPIYGYSVHYYELNPSVDPNWHEIDSSTKGSDFEINWMPKDTGDVQVKAVLVPDLSGSNTESPVISVRVLLENASPTITLTAPANGNKYFSPASITFAATALDHDLPGQGGGISKVEFYSGVEILATRTPPQALTYNWTGVPAGSYDLKAKVTDVDGATATSAVSHVVVRPPNSPPNVSLSVSPSPPYAAPVDFTLTASATDTDDSVVKVEFYRDGTQLGVDTTGPSFTWSGSVSQIGTYDLTAKAFDNYGSSTVSAPVSVTLSGNKKPVADAGSPQLLVSPNDTLANLDGSASVDSDGTLSYLWTGPAAAKIVSPTSAKTAVNFKGAAAANYTMNLLVTDNGNPALKDTAQVIVTVGHAPIIYSSLTQTAFVDSVFTYNPADSGFPRSTYTFTNKQWLAWDSAAHQLKGTPTAPGNLQVTMIAHNATNLNDTKVLNVTIKQAPKITQDIQGDSATVPEKGKITLSVTAIGTPSPSYQWQVKPLTGGSFQPVGPHASSYALDTLTPSQSGNYQVVVTNGVGAGAKSKIFKLTVKPLPKPIKAQDKLVGQSVIKDAKVIMHLKYTGEPPLYYQWFKDGKSLGAPAINDTNRVINAVALADAGLYRVRITDNVPDSMWSDTATLTVNLRRLPKPKADPPTKTFPAPFDVVLSCDTPQTQIYYTVNGKNPNRSSTLYSAPIHIDTTRTLKAIAYKTGFDSSTILTENYTPEDQLPMPVISPEKQTFSSSVTFTLTDDTAGAAIYYTLNGKDPATTGKKYDTAVTLAATTTVLAIARKANLKDSPLLTWTYTRENIQLAADRPSIEPPTTSFLGKMDVSLTSNPGTTVKYTLDGSDPRISSTADTVSSGGLVTLTRSARINAYAFGGNYSAGDTVIRNYVLIPGPVLASPSPENFLIDNSVTVTLTVSPPQATLYYSTDETPPIDAGGKLLPGGKLYPESGIQLDSTTTIIAMAYYDKVVSAQYPFGYTKLHGRVATPTAVTPGNATTFYDNITVALTATQGATIKYTLNGERPDVSGKVYEKPFVIDSTTTVTAQASLNNFLDSKILLASFTLFPDTPSVSVTSGAYYETMEPIVLTARSKRTPIRYTLNGDDPRADSGTIYTAPIKLTRSATLKALTVSGNLVSPVRQENYIVFTSKDTLVAPGQSYYLQGGYVLANPEDQSAVVNVGLRRKESLKVKGFANVQYALELSLADGATEFPSMRFTTPPTEKRSLYKEEKNGLAYFISSADTVTLSAAGTYFMGEDTMPPVVQYLRESIEGDSTLLQFHLQDNVANLSYDAVRTDSAELEAVQQPFFAPGNLDFKLKNKPGSFKPLYFQLSVRDYQFTTYVPDDPSTLMALSQKVSAEIHGPTIWSVGADGDPWDLISIPFDLDPKLTVGGFAGAGISVQGNVWNDKLGKAGDYEAMKPGDTIEAGRAYWIGSTSRLASFSHPAAKLAAHGPGKYKIKLKHGWNQIGNPSMEKMYWPVPRYEEPGSKQIRASYGHSGIMGLWSYFGNGEFRESDTLGAWRGYLVFNYGGDTTAELSSRPIPRFGLKKQGPLEVTPVISLAWAGAQPVTLGAISSASDRAGREDEVELPSRGRFRLRALREGIRLASDWVRYDHRGVHSWRVAMAGGNLRATAAPLRIASLELPPGFEAWIISEARGMKFKLTAGAEIEPSGLPEDTLRVLAGPAEKLAAYADFKDQAVSAPELNVAVLPQAGGFLLKLSLPGRSDVRARLWEMRGKALAEFLPGTLAEGAYRFSFDDFHKEAAAPAQGIYFLTVEIRGAASTARMTKKVLLRY